MDISKIKIDNSVLDVKDTTARNTLQLLGTASVKDAPASGNASNSQVVLGNDTRLSDPRPASDVYEWAKASTKPTYTKSDVGLGNVTNDSQVKRSEMGVASGVATLDSTGKVPSTQLPSYVDDVIEGYMYNGKFYAESTHETLITGESGKIYSDLSTSKIYRWGGSAFAVISDTITVGTTQGTAFDGKSGYDHVNNTSNPHSVTKSQVGLGNVGNFKAVSTVASQDLTDTEKSNARANIGAGTSNFSGSYTDLTNKPTIPDAQIQSDWNLTNTSSKDYIKNKPSSMPASDVYSWAKASSKPSYSYSEISNTPSSLPASDVSAWAKAANKPSYNLDEVSDGSTRKLADKIGKTIETTRANLKSLRDNSQLIPGQWYRITDYTCTTTQANTQSAGHQFDVIVRADDVNVLNENAYAAIHAGDTYFTNAGANLAAWELKYCIDNDTNKFAWADTTNGKGVIYYMKDEQGNECPYDFKNILFKIATNEKAGIVASFHYYTFSVVTTDNDYVVTDHSLDYLVCYDNKISRYYLSKILRLNANVFCSTSKTSNCMGNRIGMNCYNNSFGNGCTYNSLRYNSINNKFGTYCSNNKFGAGCQNIMFGNYCLDNTIGNGCNTITFGTSSEILDNCRHIVVGDNIPGLKINCSATTSYNSPLRNIKISSVPNNNTEITHPTTNDRFQTEYTSAESKVILI